MPLVKGEPDVCEFGAEADAVYRHELNETIYSSIKEYASRIKWDG